MDKNSRFGLINLQTQEERHFTHRTHLESILHHLFKFLAQLIIGRTKDNVIDIHLYQQKIFTFFFDEEGTVDQTPSKTIAQ
ncbi:hypothetical protein HanHA300_Chr11g0398721 [Helianthus annuus]|nr:hypothetical protein HanHA300_Chr11g0398721 [Helianthus annuus]KAJ0517155.1 hypothetical protein HanHA89_Chr11g0422041 [Helianthus annuus]KAJ0685163.1 hypothetical protein HanLR1_Chr11g0399461 [Helianthus annuus]KAJ0689078.1 hypothetical protein HanOQP8_Chr11g0401531 [Helianthus annuus]